MNKFALTAVASVVLSISAQAGHQVVTVSKNPKNPVPESCFADHELQLDVFGAFSNYKGDNGFGGGIGLNYFFTRNIGLGIEAQYVDTDNSAWTGTGSVIFRFPIEGSFCWAPYLKVQGGVTDNDVKAGFYGGGGGVEFRLNPHWGLFAEGTYNWAAADQDFANARLGVRFVF